MHRWKHIILLLALPMLTNAQVLSSKGRFSVQFSKGCNPMDVEITELDSFGDVTRQYYYFEGAGITNNKSFSYQDPGTYQIVQVVGVDAIEDKTDTLIVQVMTSIEPDIQIEKCSGFEISLTSLDTYYDSIRVYFTSTDSATLFLNQSATFTFSSSENQVVRTKGLFNNADEVCTSFFLEFTPSQALAVPVIETASIKESCKDVFTLYLQLSAVDSLSNYQIELTQNSSRIIFDGFLSEPNLVLPDIDFERIDYCLRIAVIDPCNNTTETGSDYCDQLNELSLSPFETLYSTYTSSGIYLNVDSVTSGTFSVYRKLESEEYEFRSEQTQSFTDPIGSKGRKYFYRIDYVDSCNQILFTTETHPPFVDAELESTNRYSIIFTPPINSLDLNPSNSYQTGNDFSQTEEPISQSEFTVMLDAKDGSPRQLITATSSYSSNLTLKSNAVTVRHELIIYVPKAFTPNGDGLNDTLAIYGLPTNIATTNIYNRWGQLVYTSVEPSMGWDGTVGSSIAPEGTYLYEITFETANGDKQMQKGTFALIKN